MSTRAKAKRKAKARRHKTAAKVTTRRKTKAVRKKVSKKPPLREKKGKPRARIAAKPTPLRPPAKTQAARPAPSMPPQATPPEERIGVVTHYFSHLAVATIRLETGTLHVGDVIHIRGHTTDFRQKIESLEVNHAPTTEVGMNDDFGLKVVEHAREHDVVYKVRQATPNG